MTNYNNLSDIEELILCSHCRRTFNDSNLLPKDLACKHTFCLECIQTGLGKASKGSASRLGELYCELCWKLTELTDKGPEALETNSPRLNLVQLCMTLKHESSSITNGCDATAVKPSLDENSISPFESCEAHGAPLGLWCIDCKTSICEECQIILHSEPRLHRVWPLQQARDQLVKEAYAELSCMSHLDENVRQLAKRQRQFLILIRDACTALMKEVQSSLDSDWNVDPTLEIREGLTQIQLALMDAKSPKEVHELFPALVMKKQDLQAKCQEMIIQCQLNDLIGHSADVFNFNGLREAVASILSNKNDIKPISLQQPLQDPILFLTNYCMSQLFSRGDSFLLNHNMQSQPVIGPPDVLTNSIPPVIPTSPQHVPLNEPSDIFASSNDINLHQIEYSPPQGNIVQMPVQSPAQVPIQPAMQPQMQAPIRSPVHLPLQTSPQPPEQCPIQESDHAALLAHPNEEENVLSPPPSPPPPFPPTNQATTAQIVQMQSAVVSELPQPPVPIIHPPVRPVPARSPANVLPRYFFNIEINGVAKGKIVIETRPDVAPKMCRNFDRLTTADRKASCKPYKGCNFFQCWKNESVITGDNEYNTGRGGKSIYEDGYFNPDETRLPAVRGAVGMRRQQKKHDNFGLVGSQFRIILQDIQGFTGIFGHVVEGIELVEVISNFGDHTGKPSKTIMISKCGKL